MTFRAKTVADCYRIARREARAFQRVLTQLDRQKYHPERIACLSARDAADRIAHKIRFGKRAR